jgi:hypothetical protein
MRLPTLLILILVAGVLAGACGTSPSAPDALESRIVVTRTNPSTARTVVVPADLPPNVFGGVVIPRGSGLLSVELSVTSAHEVPWAQLSVYLITGEGRMDYCGQNDPDAPTWQFLPSGWTTAYTVTGFSVYRLPCDVTGIRAMLHMRNNGLLIPPLPTETVAETTFPLRLQLRREGAVAE